MADEYVLEDQVGFVLRRAAQRHSALFAQVFEAFDMTPLQFAALMKLADEGEISQNRLGRLTAMDPNTIQGVVLRLVRRGLVERRESPSDRRQKLLRLTDAASDMLPALRAAGHEVTVKTLAPLDPSERARIVETLKRMS